MELAKKAVDDKWWLKVLRRVTRFWLTVRYQILDWRYGRLVLESIDEVALIVLPSVFNPVLLRSGEFMVKVLDDQPLSPKTRVLDLGTGSGIGAVFAARRSARVTAVDINPEAVRCARINALLNDLADRIEVVEGDLFDPVAGKQFDLILFNPPYYRGKPINDLDHAWRGEDVFERFSANLADFLAPGGRCLIVLSTDGQGDQLLALLARVGFHLSPIARKVYFNETLTVYQVKRDSNRV